MAKEKTEFAGRLFSVTAIQLQGSNKAEGDLIQFYLEAESIEQAFEIGRPKAHAIIGSNCVVRVGEVRD